ncbi:hypothetical protein B0H17DRAFT_1202118 [Mycena rosella]|uniref:Uncharacterized protein n=1 Tax=Mycena rosella TaxID=1033263 RepID=A0AAD7DGD8_MYCRO|nr:hypothetical protein B0H17DRAFT_1202118 [Mycena rosella]
MEERKRAPSSDNCRRTVTEQWHASGDIPVLDGPRDSFSAPASVRSSFAYAAPVDIDCVPRGRSPGTSVPFLTNNSIEVALGERRLNCPEWMPPGVRFRNRPAFNEQLNKFFRYMTKVVFVFTRLHRRIDELEDASDGSQSLGYDSSGRRGRCRADAGKLSK